MKIKSIVLGVGPGVGRWKIGTTSLRLNTYPLVGLTLFGSDTDRWLRPRFWFAVLCGPLTSAALFLIALYWPDPLRTVEFVFSFRAMVTRPAMLNIFGSLNLWLLIGNLFPIRLPDAATESDGLKLLTLPF